MTQKEKMLKKFSKNPESVKYSDIVWILENIWYEKIQAKWSHVKFKHKDMKNDIIIPVHNNDCKAFYKNKVYKTLKDNSLI